MEYRRLGRSGLKLGEVGLGSWLTVGHAVDEQATTEIVRKAYELGVNFFDTANVYAAGRAEQLVGQALRELPRDTYVLATKVFFPMGEKPNQSGLSRKHIHEQAHASLKRLGADYIDLYQAHRYDNDAPLDEVLRAFDDLVRAGKVLYVGVSMWTANQIMQAHALAEQMNLNKIVSNQPAYNMLHRDIEKDVISTCESLGVGQLAYSPLAQGVLTGKYSGGAAPTGSRGADPKGEGMFMGRYLRKENIQRVQRLQAVAADLGMTMAQMALTWCLRQKNVSSVICGAKRPQQLEENVAASGKTIPEDALQRIEDILT
ncbi:MAG: voltage-gated potassium channel [Phycisphaerae bacterium SM23_33]|nr:MAG: voltage-gated potassium channel [Phycisphaerae bacterium SM23_33]